ncbi:hypothetical protein KBD33_01665 [Candidatus Gracilibacteria bacterium]|nr:hypothetical protein [Candidatus Gracilibacteria bacterium]
MNSVTSVSRKDQMHLFKNEKGYTYVSSMNIPSNQTDEYLGIYYFSPKERRIIQNFKIDITQDLRQGDFFPETIPSIQDFRNFYVSEMLRILISEGSSSSRFERVPTRELIVRSMQLESISWDPKKAREVPSFTERRVYSTKTRVAYVLKK